LIITNKSQIAHYSYCNKLGLLVINVAIRFVQFV
jgi:hypothetical protein